MAVLPILRYPDIRLHTVAKPVTVFDSALKKLTEDMLETMYASSGIGLAATQIDVHQRVIVLDVSENSDAPMVFVNPKMTQTSSDLREYKEGCLSVPGIYEVLRRPSRVEIAAQDVTGKPFTVAANELLATCIQHEMDHLDGKVFVQKLSFLKQTRIRTKLQKGQDE